MRKLLPILLIAIFLGAIPSLSAQTDSTDYWRSGVYTYRPAIELPLTGALFVANYFGLRRVSSDPGLSLAEANALRVEDVPGFDRFAVRNIEQDRLDRANDISDIIMNTSFGLPIILMAEKRLRPDWKKIYGMYLELQGVTAIFYSWGGARWVDRARPLVYNTSIDPARRTGNGTLNSFYSGHVASPTAATFFTVKVWTDYHPEWTTGRKIWMYGVASVPSAAIGYLRYEAQKHFLSDIVVGYVIGAGLGILLPELHKNGPLQWSFAPARGMEGVAVTYRF